MENIQKRMAIDSTAKRAPKGGNLRRLIRPPKHPDKSETTNTLREVHTHSMLFDHRECRELCGRMSPLACTCTHGTVWCAFANALGHKAPLTRVRAPPHRPAASVPAAATRWPAHPARGATTHESPTSVRRLPVRRPIQTMAPPRESECQRREHLHGRADLQRHDTVTAHFQARGALPRVAVLREKPRRRRGGNRPGLVPTTLRQLLKSRLGQRGAR